MSGASITSATLCLPQPLWKQVERVAKAQKREPNQVVEEALDQYLSNEAPKTLMTPEEKKTMTLKKLYEGVARHRREFARLVAQGKVHPLPKDIPLEKVREGLSGIKGALTAEVIREREEGW